MLFTPGIPLDGSHRLVTVTFHRSFIMSFAPIGCDRPQWTLRISCGWVRALPRHREEGVAVDSVLARLERLGINVREVREMVWKWLVIVISLVPWGAFLFLHYWLEYEQVWSVDMPYRALISALLIFLGMSQSFGLYSWLVAIRERLDKPG